MNKNKALEVMLTEKCCVERQEDISKCDRRCGECDLLLPTEEVLQAYDFVINMLTEKERPHGKWIYHEDWYLGEESPWECSECGTCYDYGDNTNFCGECGADMRERGDRE